MRRIIYCFLFAISALNMAQGQGADSSQCKENKVRALRIERTEGWSLTFVDKSKPLGKGPYKPIGQVDEFTSTQYSVKSLVVPLPEVILDSCERTAALGTLYFVPQRVSAIEKNGQLFAYVAFGKLVTGPESHAGGIGTTMNVIFYDLHGTGRFDAIQTMAPVGVPFVPSWVK